MWSDMAKKITVFPVGEHFSDFKIKFIFRDKDETAMLGSL